MITEILKTNQIDLKCYICEACGFGYIKPEYALKCENWSKEYGFDNHLAYGHFMGSWRDEKGAFANVVERPGSACVKCKKEFLIGDVRYPISFSGNVNICRDCKYSREGL